MAVITIAKTVGASGADFSTPQLWEDGAPANLTTAEKSSAGTFLVAAFTQGETITFVGSGATGKFLHTDSTGAGTGSYIIYGLTSGNVATNDVATGGTSGATCIISSGTPTDTGVIWQGQQKNEEFTGTGTQLAIAGSTSSAACYKEYTTVAGASFADNANKLTNALRYNASNGAAINGTSNGGTTVTITGAEDFARVTGMQITATGVAAMALSTIQATTQLRSCIFEGTVTGTGTAIGVIQNAAMAFNCLIVLRATSADHIVSTANSSVSKWYNCTIVAADDLATAPASVFKSGSAGAVLVQNCGLFAGADKPTTSGSATYTFTTCYGDDSTPATGITTATFSSEFQNVNDATRDFRLKAGAAELDTGTTDATNAPTDIVGTTRPQGSAYDVGCWELVVAASVVPVLYHHYQQARMT